VTEETQAQATEDAPLSPVESEADPSPAPEAQPEETEQRDPQPRDEEGKFLSPKAQKRIDQLVWEKNETLRQAEYWRQLAMQQKPEPKAEELKIPTLESVGYDETKYQAALLDYSRSVAREEAKSLLEAERKQQTEQNRLESFAKRQQDFAKANPDYHARISDPTLPITEAMRDVIVDSPTGPELAYYLASNRETAEAISRLPAHLAALELGRIDGRLSAEKEAKKRPVVTQAPPPPPKVEQVDVPVDKDPEQMSPDEWLKWRNKQLSKAATKRR
jgi:hypothetical protein